VNDEDAMWVVNDDDSEIEWAGWPDFFGGSRYVTNALNTVQRDLGPGPIGPVFGGGQLPLIDLDKTRSLVPDFPKRRLNPLYVGVQGVSMNGFDFVSTDKFGAKGDILVAEYGQYYNPLSLNRHELEFCLDGDGRADASLCEDYEHEGHVVRRIHLVTINNHVVGTSSRVFLKHSHDQNGGVHGLFPVDLKFDKKGTKAYVVNMGFDFTDPGGFAPHGEILEVTRSVN
jgi:hypothetical protein